jgi:hypothetical protein
MDRPESDLRYQTPEELAGPNYNEMVLSKRAALACLSASDLRLRVAAIMICHFNWNCGTDPRVVEACRSIAESDADDSIRVCAVTLLGVIFDASKRLDISRFLANLVLCPTSSRELLTNAYWALRQVQFGLSDASFDNFIKGTIHMVRSQIRIRPGQLSEEIVKAKITPKGCFPEGFWESADVLDLDFVRQFIEGEKR